MLLFIVYHGIIDTCLLVVIQVIFQLTTICSATVQNDTSDEQGSIEKQIYRISIPLLVKRAQALVFDVQTIMLQFLLKSCIDHYLGYPPNRNCFVLHTKYTLT